MSTPGNQRFCVHCGAPNSPSNKFCSSCGAEVGAHAPRPTPAAPAPGSAQSSGRGLKVALLVIGVLVVAAVAAVAVFALGGSSSASGGASSATEAVTKFQAALNRSDFLAALDLLPPDERQDMPDLFKALTSKAKESGTTHGGLPAVAAETTQQPPTTLGNDAEAVSVTGTLRFDVSRLDGDLHRVLATRGARDSREYVLPGTQGPNAPNGRGTLPAVRIVAIKQHGRWFVDPLLTVADYVTIRLNLPQGDYTSIATGSGQGGSSATAAVEQLIRGLSAQDASAVADVSSPAVERLLRVYGTAAGDLLRRSNTTFSVTNVDVADSGASGVVVRALDIQVQSANFSPLVRVHSYCVNWTRSSGSTSPDICIPAPPGLRSELGLTYPMLHVEKTNAGYRVDLIGSLTELLKQATDRAQNTSIAGYLRSFIRPSAEVKPAAIGKHLQGAFDGLFIHDYAVKVIAGSASPLHPTPAFRRQ